jgi:protein gp37
MRREWVESILEQSRHAGIPFFFKQWGGVRKKRLGRELHGRIYEELPENILSLRRVSAAVNKDKVMI